MMKPLFSHILVAVSGSDASIHAAKYAIIMAKQYRCRLSVIYVVDTATLRQLTASKIFIQEESADYEQSLESNGNRYLAFVEEMASAKGVKVEKELCRGTVYSEILRVADEKKVDLILMGGWEKDRNARDIISHAHREVLVSARCSVFIVKEPNIDQLYRQA